MARSLTDDAIDRIREFVRSGRFPAGSRLPPEHELATELGISRSPTREAVKALELARVLEVRRGDGTYVTSLAPSLLLEGLGNAVSLMEGSVLELTEVRRLLEPAATGVAATRITDAQLRTVAELLDAMQEAVEDVERLTVLDAAFHRAVVTASGNETLTALLDGISSRTLRARIWRGTVDRGVTHVTLAQHKAIYDALAGRDPAVATAAALMHVDTSERWLRAHLAELPILGEQ
ncbi:MULTISPECIES: FadR/GntR family transcriptional regulator [unclassified Amycolatopsis]|uniref:FadR/GntR family transcriptional regulator n=1 Tax=unclassified Amycolatopsis TaxID=2618356 RepID=UPI002E163B68|nr:MULTISPECIES: FadR/GntR family transcriptional regulator [unclassified Amycolatopsis]WSJ80361.1 FadR family transcriptional regulator [Amycolatopsis sp. NBC_01307]WSK76158.1 FadR family transcriptional regulator [Amycolatopsis sp. NBC_01286]